MKEKSIKKNALFNIFRTFLSTIYPLITFPYASRILLPEGIGKVNFANTIVSLFQIIASLGIVTYGTRELAKIRNDQEKANKLYSELFAINSISTIITYILFFIVLIFVPKLYPYRSLLLISVTSIFFTLIGVDWIYTSFEDFDYVAIRQFIFQILSLAFLFIFVKTKSDYLYYCAFGVLSNVGSNICNFFHKRHFVKTVKIKFSDLKKHLKPVFILFVIPIATSVYTILDTSMLGFLSDNTEIGYYSAATKVIRLLLPLLSSINIVIVSRLSLYAELDKEHFNTLLNKSINLIQMIALPATAGLFLLSKQIILTICGESYFNSIFVMQIITPITYFILTGGSIGDQLFTTLRKDKYNLIPVIVGAIVNFVFNYIFIPKFGAVGAAIGTLCAEFFVNSLKVFFARQYIHEQKLFRDIWKYFLATIIMSCIVFIETCFIHNNFICLFTGIITGFIVYSICLYLLKSKTFIFIFELIFKRKIKDSNS